LFTHSFETYSGANNRIVLPKFLRVIIRDSLAIASICPGPFASSNPANLSISADLREGRASRMGMMEVCICFDIIRQPSHATKRRMTNQ
jgi:hypothetical protein